MTERAKAKSRIMEAVHETACDLNRLGFINKRKMHEFDALCLASETPEYDAVKIKEIRERFELSQAAFAAVLNTSLSTVRQWESGKKHPGGPSRKLLDILERKGLEVLV